MRKYYAPSLLSASPAIVGFEDSLLNVVVNPVKPLNECVQLLLLLSEGSLTGEDVCLTLALVFFFLDGRPQVSPFIVASWLRDHEACSFLRLVGVQVGLHRGTAQVILEEVKDGCRLRPTMATMVDGGIASARHLVAAVDVLRRHLRVVARLLRHCFFALVWVECLGHGLVVLASIIGANEAEFSGLLGKEVKGA